MATRTHLRRVAPYFSILWLAAIIYDVAYFRYKSMLGIPDCLHLDESSCYHHANALENQAPPTTNYTTKQQEQGRRQDEPVHLVYASDDESLFAVEASIRSAIHHASEPIQIHLVSDTRPTASFPNLHFYNLKNVSKTFKLQDFTNPRKRGTTLLEGLNSNLANYVRFVIHELLPNATKAMWMDADTIFNCDIVEMYRRTLVNSSYVIAAVPVDGPPHGVKRVIKRKYLKRYSSYTFNAGVYVVDLEKWRSKDMTSKIRKLTLKNRKNRFYNYGSQPPLALAIGDQFEHLSPAWNVKVNKLNLGLLGKEKACLYHWSGKRKPWNTKNDPDIHEELWRPYSNENITK